MRGDIFASMPDADWVGKDLVCALKVCGMRDVCAFWPRLRAGESAAGAEPRRAHITGHEDRAAVGVRASARVDVHTCRGVTD